MSLLVKIKNYGALLLLCLVILNSCEEKGDFGIATDDVAPVEFITENIAVNSSMVQLDSVITAYQGRFMAGNLINSPWGNITSTGFIGINARTDVIPEFDDDASYDSMRVEFTVNFLHDSSANNRDMQIELFDVTEEIVDTLYIGKNSLNYSSTLFASGAFDEIKIDSSYTIDANDQWGQEFFNGMTSGAAQFESQENFEDYFPGIAVRAFSQQGNIFGISPDVNFRILIYYSEPNEEGTDIVQKSFEFNGFTMPYFFGVESDRSGSAFSAVIDANTAYDNTSVIGVNSGSGLVTKLDISNLAAFSDNIDGIIINSAELFVGEVNDTDEQYLPNSLILYLTDERNTRIRSGNSYRSIQRDGSNQLGNGSPVQLFYNIETKTYSASITSFVQDYYKDRFRRDEIFLYPTDMNSTFRGFTLDKSNVRLKIYYSLLQ